MIIIKIEIRVEEVIVAVHHEIPRMASHQNNVIIMIIEIRMVIQKLLLQEMEIIRMPLPRMVLITNHKKIKMTVNQKMVTIVRLRQVGIEIRIRHQDGATETSMAAVVDDVEIVHEVDHGEVDQVTSGIDPIVENVIEIDRVGQIGTVDDLIVHIIITGQGRDHVKGQEREDEEEEVTIITEDQTEIEDHTVDQGHVNAGLEVGRRSLHIIEAVVVAAAVGGEIDQDQ